MTDKDAHGVEHGRSTQEVYKGVLAAIEYNTGGPQPDAMRLSALVVNRVAHGPDDRDAVETALRAALENDAIVIYPDREGELRVATADAPDHVFREAIDIQVESSDPDRDIIGRCNRLLEEDTDG